MCARMDLWLGLGAIEVWRKVCGTNIFVFFCDHQHPDMLGSVISCYFVWGAVLRVLLERFDRSVMLPALLHQVWDQVYISVAVAQTQRDVTECGQESYPICSALYPLKGTWYPLLAWMSGLSGTPVLLGMLTTAHSSASEEAQFQHLHVKVGTCILLCICPAV